MIKHVQIIFITSWLSIFAFSQVNAAPSDQGASKMSAVAEIAIEVTQNTVLVHLTVSNPSKIADLRVEKRKALASPSLRSDLFRVRCEGKEVRYIGIMAKMKAPGLDDYLRVPPGGHINGTADLTSLYAFLPGMHQYTIDYYAFFDDPVDKTKLIEVTSNQVSFSFQKK